MIRHYLRCLLPDFWIMIYPYSPSWDAALNRLLDSYRFSDIGECDAVLGEVKVWVANRPYGAFTPIIDGRSEEVRPSRATIARAMQRLTRDGVERANFDDICQGEGLK